MTARAEIPLQNKVGRLLKRADFLSANAGKRIQTPAFTLLALNRGDQNPARAGFTCSKKVGNSVARNRAKRRLREIVRLSPDIAAHPGWDYVLIGRQNVTAKRDFDLLRQDLHQSLHRLHPA